ncbi:MAG: DEAD/DEAH box helicase [Bacteroidetes bacterium]|nr:DEAD/DEAH box helicase [Bacteroidota bacterium]
MQTFQSLSLMPAITEALTRKGYTTPTPVQSQAIPPALSGKDIFATAQTGTGKTAAFAIPILQRLAETPATGAVRALILAPTRELAIQIYDQFVLYGGGLRLRTAVIYGGVSQKKQEDELRRKPDILVATPGRLLDLMSQKLVNLHKVEMLVLDECDRMLDMGFIHDIRKVTAQVPRHRQTLLFSATVPAEIRKLAADLLNEPVQIDVEPPAGKAALIVQQLYSVDRTDKVSLLKYLLDELKVEQALVFTRTKRGADRLARVLDKGGYSSRAIHGDKSQSQRESALRLFKSGDVMLLIATDLASRGIDVKELGHVFNYDLPGDAESYTHRIGRTGRAGQEGIAVSFTRPDDKDVLKQLRQRFGSELQFIDEHPWPASLTEAPAPVKQETAKPAANRGNRNNRFRRR